MTRSVARDCRWHPALRFAAGLLLAAALAACGGGGGGDGGGGGVTPPPQPTVPAPQVTNAPVSLATAAGTTARFSVSAVGALLSYQWQRNGVAIGGATGASYEIAAVSGANNGDRYRVVVSNSGGSVTSVEAVLTVFAAPAAAASCATGGATSALQTGAAVVGKPFGVVLAGCTAALTSVTWTQTGGPELPLLAARIQALHLEPTVPGSYQFSASGRGANNNSFTVPVAVTVGAAAPVASPLALRTTQAVREGQRASMRAWPSNAPAGATVEWSQVEGPATQLELSSDGLRALFTAPAVAQDTVLRFRAVLRAGGAELDRADALVVVENLPPAPTGQLFDEPSFFASRVYAYRASSPYAAALAGCVYSPALYFNTSNGSTNLCTLNTLPLLAQTAATPNVPSVAEVMDRVLVSHDWMGAAFESFLNTQDVHGDFRRLLGSVTAIVIGAHVRPSFFWSATGAIYLDADNFWLTPEQRDVVSEVPDFRSGYDAELNYTGLWRYVIGNTDAQQFFSPSSRQTRPASYLINELGPLLYHELAHAGDAYPYAGRRTLAGNQYAYQAAVSATTAPLAAEYPLQSQTLFGLARVKFHGQTATAEQKALTPAEVGAAFAADRATDEYNYSVPLTSANPNVSAEDPAMLLEEFMMLYRHGIRRDVAMTNKFRPGLTSVDLLVAWGQRGRIAVAPVRPRVKQVAGTIVPWIEAAQIDAALDAAPAVAMRTGESWFANLVLPGPLGYRAGFDRQMSLDEQMRLIERRLQLRQEQSRRSVTDSRIGPAMR